MQLLSACCALRIKKELSSVFFYMEDLFHIQIDFKLYSPPHKDTPTELMKPKLMESLLYKKNIIIFPTAFESIASQFYNALHRFYE